MLAEIGEKANIKVTDEEVNQALIERARQFPGQEQQVWDFYRKNPQALAELRAPIFEEKVVDHVLGQVNGRGDGLEGELFADEDDDEGGQLPTEKPAEDEAERLSALPDGRRLASVTAG